MNPCTKNSLILSSCENFEIESESEIFFPYISLILSIFASSLAITQVSESERERKKSNQKALTMYLTYLLVNPFFLAIYVIIYFFLSCFCCLIVEKLFTFTFIFSSFNLVKFNFNFFLLYLHVSSLSYFYIFNFFLLSFIFVCDDDDDFYN